MLIVSCCLAQFVDGDHMSVVCGTQDPASYQSNIAQVLNLPLNKVIVRNSRTGGGFGGKISRGCLQRL